ncbi:MAG: hypothetical protein ACI9C1_001294 [Candidatus Aldehydirespiratoraceae bacterium]
MESKDAAMRIRPALATTASFALLIAVATLPLRNVFDDWNWAISVIGAAIAASAIASAIESLRRDIPLPAIALITVIGAAFWALAVALRDTFYSAPFGRDVWGDLTDGVFGGWGALLEEQFPLTDPLAAETFAAFLAWMFAGASVHLSVRFRTALPGIGAGAVMLAVCTAAAVPQGLPTPLWGVLAGAVALLAISTVTRARDQRLRPGRAAALAAVISAAAAVAGLAGLFTASLDREPFDPRSSRSLEVVQIQVPDILSEFGVRRENTQPVMTLESTGSVAGLRLRLQVYDAHDGERWLPSREFDEIATFPRPDELPPGDVVSATVRLEELDGPWVPLPDRLTQIDLSDLRWNETSQTAITASRIDSYEFTGTVVSQAGLEGLSSANEEVDESFRAVPPGLADDIRDAAALAVAESTDTISAIDAIKARLREIGRNESVAPGNSLGRLHDDFTTGNSTGAEQIASLHALMLRSVGIPSRVVVGYVASGEVIKPTDLHVWTETPFPGFGWVASDPVPAVIESTDDAPDEVTGTPTTLPKDSILQARALPRELGPGEDPDEAEIATNNDLGRRGLFLIASFVTLTLLALMVFVRVIRRRFRHSSGWRAEVRVLGAWAETVDRLRELGAPVTPATTIDDVVYMATNIDGPLGAKVRTIGDLAAIALHGPNGSHPDEADAAWEQVRVVETSIRQANGRLTAARRFLDPRVLRYRAPKPPPNRDGGRRSRTPAS